MPRIKTDFFPVSQVVLIVSENPANKQMEESLSKLASDQDIQISSTFYLPGQYISRYVNIIEGILKESHKKTRGRIESKVLNLIVFSMYITISVHSAH